MKSIKLNLVCFFFKLKPAIKNSIDTDNYQKIIKDFKEQYNEINARIKQEKGMLAFHRMFLIIGLALYKALHNKFQNQEELIEKIHDIL